MQNMAVIRKQTPVKFEKRLTPSPVKSLIVLVISIVLAFLLGAIFIKMSGFSPWKVYYFMLSGAFGTGYGISETIVKAIPLMLAGLGVAIAFRMLLWNIGAEGQLYMGAFAATWVALSFPDWPSGIMILMLLAAGFLGGALWSLIPAIARSLIGVNEIITTLMFNYISIFWIGYFVFGPWKDPQGFNQPLTAKFSANAMLPTIADTRIHLGLLFGFAAAVILYLVLGYTRWGYEIRVTGENQNAARYGGININRNIILVMCLSGGLAGLAGMVEVTGVLGRLQQGISPGYGYMAIIVSVLARLHPLGVVLVSFLFGGLLVGGYSVQTMGVPTAIVSVLQGSILFFVLTGEFLCKYDVVLSRREN